MALQRASQWIPGGAGKCVAKQKQEQVVARFLHWIGSSNGDGRLCCSSSCSCEVPACSLHWKGREAFDVGTPHPLNKA